ncbi:MAG: hypothetical protein V4671_10005 [Armatimonadota bacterium]
MTKTTRNGNRRSRVIIGSIVGVTLAGAALLPGTGWLVRQQARALFFSATVPWDAAKANQTVLDRQQAVAASRPADFPLQMALALQQTRTAAPESDASANRCDALRQLERTYDGQPSLYAAVLRELSTDAVKLDHRMDQFELEPVNPERADKHVAPVRPAALPEWLRAAERGAALDRDNAFFPLMRAAGLYAGHRDAEALAEIQRAGTLSRYDDYVHDEATGGWALAEAGQDSTLPSVSLAAVSAATRLPHFALLRASARLTAVQAMHLEQAGKVEEGFALRRALLRCGARMRTDSNWLIGNMVGEAIAAAAQARPGGAPPLPRRVGSSRISGDERAALRVKQYEAYLAKIGHPEEIAQVRHEVSARREIHSSISQGLDKGPSSIANLLVIMALWAGGIALMGNILWVLIFGAASTGLARTTRIRNGEALLPGVKWGIGLSSLPIAVVLGATVSGGFGVSALLVVLAVLALGLGAGADHLRDRRRKRYSEKTDSTVDPASSLHPSLRIAAVTTAVVTLLSCVLYWLGGSFCSYADAINTMIGFRPMTVSGSGIDREPLVRLISAAIMTAIPFLTAGILAIASRIRRVPVSVGTVRGFARAALPLAVLLSLLYVGVVAVTSVRETSARQALRATVAHEGRACAAYSGRVWPTFTP